MPNPYETDRVVAEYLLLHYGEPDHILPYSFGPRQALGFPQRTVTELVKETSGARALELGCAVGRAAFELSRFCHQVVAIDYSQKFIEAAERLRQAKAIDFDVPEEGELVTRCRFVMGETMHPERVEFQVGDASVLPADLGTFDIVVAANLLCRLPQPQKLLERLPELVRSGGQLVLTSPYTWMEEYTPKKNWLGGFRHQGEAIRSLETLKSALRSDFRLVDTTDMPFLIREHARKFQFCVAQASRWERV